MEVERDPRVVPMERTGQILRRSIHCFFKNYQFFTTKAAFLTLPFSASFLLSQVVVVVPSYSPLFPTICNRLTTLFQAAGFPPSQFFSLLTHKLSQTLSSSIFALPFTLTFLLAAKAFIIECLTNRKFPNSNTSFSSVLPLYIPLLKTSVCNTLLLLSANSTAFSILFFVFNFLQGFSYCSPKSVLFLSAAGAVLYSIILANALIICNLATIVSGAERSGGYLAILRACLLIQGKTSTALSLAVPVNLLLAGVEALFHYRIVRPYHRLAAVEAGISTALEGLLIAYLYSLCLVLETVVNYMFFRCCKTNHLAEEITYDYRIEIEEEENSECFNLKHHDEQLPL